MFFFTVIIPTYNRLNYLKQSINSVINQSFQDWNLQIIDNSSNDGTIDYLKELAKKDKRINFNVVKNNGIIAYSRNHGLNQAKSKAVSFLDDDDIWLRSKLEDDYKVLNKMEGLVYSRSYSFSDKKNIIGTLPSRKVDLKNPLFDLLHYGNIFTTSTISYSLNSLTKNMRFNESETIKTWEDYELWLRLILDAKLSPFYINKFNTKYRISNLQNSSFKQDLVNNKNISKFLKKYYEDQKIIRINKLPLWAHYSNISSYLNLNKFKNSLLSLINSCAISVFTFDIGFFVKSLLKFVYIYKSFLIKRFFKK